MRNSIIYIAILFSIVTTGCKKDPALPSGTVAASTQLNVSYGTDPLQKMDVYLPAGRSADSTKLMVMIHGGAWSTGDKAEFNAFVDTLKARFPAYAIANLNYRLFDNVTNKFPTQENDIDASINFLYNQRSDWKYSDKFVLLGASAGAHLALLQAYKHQATIKPKAVVDFFGPTDMVDMYNNPASVFVSPAQIAALMGGTPTSNTSIYATSSPLNYVTASAAMPTIILQGGLDPLVSPSQSSRLRDKLVTAGVANQYVFYPAGGHGDWNAATYTDAFNKIQLFINTYVQ